MKKTIANLILISSVLATAISFTPAASATIGFDTNAQTQNVNLTTVDTAITVTSSQSNLLLVDLIWGWKNGGSSTISSVLGAGKTMTQLISTSTTSGSSTWALYYTVAPNTGAQNVTTTFGQSNSAFEICVESFYGVNQTTPFDASSSQWLGPAIVTVSTTMTTANANDVITSFAADNGPAGSGVINPAPGSGDTATCSANTGGSHMGAAYRSIPTAGATSTVWNNGTSTYGMVAGSIVPSLPPPAPTADVQVLDATSVRAGVTIR